MTDCTACHHADTCKHGTPPHLTLSLSQRGALPACHDCTHAYWDIDRLLNKRTCKTCGLVESLTLKSEKIKHHG